MIVFAEFHCCPLWLRLEPVPIKSSVRAASIRGTKLVPANSMLTCLTPASTTTEISKVLATSNEPPSLDATLRLISVPWEFRRLRSILKVSNLFERQWSKMISVKLFVTRKHHENETPKKLSLHALSGAWRRRGTNFVAMVIFLLFSSSLFWTTENFRSNYLSVHPQYRDSRADGFAATA